VVATLSSLETAVAVFAVVTGAAAVAAIVWIGAAVWGRDGASRS